MPIFNERNIAMSKSIEEIREYFSKDRYAADTGAFIEEAHEGYAKISLVIEDKHKNAVGGVMGGVYFTLADFAFAVASNTDCAGTVSLTSDISFLGVPKTQKIFAETRLIRSGRTTCCYSISVTDENGSPVAEVKTVGYHTVPRESK